MANEHQGAQNGQNNDTTVSKADLDKLSADNASLKTTLDTLQQQLTDPDYVAYIESKRSNNQAQARPVTPQDMQNVDLSKLTVGQFQQYLAYHQQEFAKTVLAPQLNAMNQTLTNLQAKLELADAERAYDDFNDYRQEVYNILSTAGNELTIDQAYKIAKGNNPTPASEGEKVETPKPMTLTNTTYRTQSNSEKPGNMTPVDGDGVKKFATKESAALDAWSQVAAKHGISGDTI